MKHKRTNRIKLYTIPLSLLLIFSLLLSGCTYPSDKQPDEDISSQQTTTEPIVTTARPDGLEKSYCKTSIDAEFLDDKIIIAVFPEYGSHEYTVEDFSEINCIDVQCDTIIPQEGKPVRYTITLATHSKQNVLDSIKLLEKREDIYIARVYFTFKDIAFATPNDYISAN